jgi:hypothetical protein
VNFFQQKLATGKAADDTAATFGTQVDCKE